MALVKILPMAPSEGSILIATIAVTDSGSVGQVTSIVQTGATWNRAVRSSAGDHRAEIWWSGDAAGADTTVTINIQSDEAEAAEVFEVFGLTTLSGDAVDQVASLATQNGDPAVAGPTAATTFANEYAVACLAIREGPSTLSPTNGFVILAQNSTGVGATDVSVSALTKTLTTIGTVDTEADISAGISDYGSAIATFFGNILSIGSVAPTIVMADGGTKLTLTGFFDADRQYVVRMGPVVVGAEGEPEGYLPSGNFDAIAPVSSSELEFYTPELLDYSGDLADIYVAEVDNPAQTASIIDKVSLVDPDLKSLSFQMRKNFPPNYRMGPRNFSVLPRVNTVQNLIIRSGEFDAADWTAVASTLTPSGGIDPFGGTEAYVLEENGANFTHAVFQSGIAYTQDDTYVLSVYAKAVNRDWVRLLLDPTTLPIVEAWFNVTTGVLGQVSGDGVSYMREIGTDTGWYRCSIVSRKLAVITSPVLDVGIAAADSDGGGAYLGLSQDSLLIAASQFDAWSVERAYVMTLDDPVI